MTASGIPALLEPIQERLDAATDAAPAPWQAVGTGVRGGDHWYVCADGQSIASIACHDGENEEQREPLARFMTAAPADTARLLASVKAVDAMHRQDTYGPHFCRCGEHWPCRTVSAVEAALRGEA